MSLIAIPITGPGLDQAFEQIRRADGQADLIEIRFDLIHHQNQVEKLTAAARTPVLATCRHPAEGGQFQGNEEERIHVLERALRSGARYADLEFRHGYSRATDLRKANPAAKIVCSFHDFTGVPEDLEETLAEMQYADADILKIAVATKTVEENARLLGLYALSPKPLLALGMGETGIVSRILGKKFGQAICFARLDENTGSALGQPTISELRLKYFYPEIGPQTRIFGVAANPVEHSLSPLLHNTAYRSIGFDAVLVPFKVENCESFLRAFEPLGLEGLAVTIPHKETFFRLAHETDEMTKKIGALNTMIRRDGKWFGTNTDLDAALSSLRRRVSLSGKSVLLLGAGGAARALVVGLLREGAQITIANRTQERAQKLADEFRLSFASWEERHEQPADIILNATSIGMFPGVSETPFDREAFRKNQVVFDAVYNPIETRFMREARGAGCEVVGGFEMFFGQAAKQVELFSGKEAPRLVMAKLLSDALGGSR